MKKITTIIHIVTGFTLLAFVSANKTDSNFEGVITYSVTTSGGSDQATALFQKATFQIFLKPGKCKSVLVFGMGKQIMIRDNATPNIAIMLSEMGSQKTEMKMDLTKFSPNRPDIKYSDETKVIAGYTCHKATITTSNKANGSVSSVDMYYTEELPAYEGRGEFKGLKGFPLEFHTKTPMGMITFTASSVKKQPVSDDAFTVPPGYTLQEAPVQR